MAAPVPVSVGPGVAPGVNASATADPKGDPNAAGTTELPPDTSFTIEEVAYVLTRHMEPYFASVGRVPWPDPAVAVALVMAESGGRSGAERPESANPGGGRDRGWWQLNSKALPQVTDATAFRPLLASQWVFDFTEGGNDFSCWGYRFNPPRSNIEKCPNYRRNQQRSLDLTTARRAVEKVKSIPTESPVAMSAIGKLMAASTTSQDTVTPNPGIPGIGGLTDLIRAALKVLRSLADPELWKRLGLGGLGLLLIIGAVALVAAARA